MSENVKGIYLIIGGMFLFSIQDILIKTLVDQASLLQILFIRGIVGSSLIILYLFLMGKPLYFGSAYPKIAFLRAIIFFFGFLAFYIALASIPIAEAASIFFVSPFIITILSRIILKNQIGWHRVSAIIVGFSGTILIIKPSFETINWVMLLPLFSAMTYSLSMILAKLTRDKDSAFQQTLHLYLGSTVLSGICALFISGDQIILTENDTFSFLFRAWQFHDIKVSITLVGITFAGTIGALCLVTAYRIGSPTVLAPFEYTLLLNGLLMGYILFNEILDFYSIIGMVIIMISGCYIFIREGIKKMPLASEITMRN